jgi:hypothetical protein
MVSSKRASGTSLPSCRHIRSSVLSDNRLRGRHTQAIPIRPSQNQPVVKRKPHAVPSPVGSQTCLDVARTVLALNDERWLERERLEESPGDERRS